VGTGIGVGAGNGAGDVGCVGSSKPKTVKGFESQSKAKKAPTLIG